MGCSTAEIFPWGAGLACPFAGLRAGVPGLADFIATTLAGFGLGLLLLAAGVAVFAATVALPVPGVAAVGFCVGALAEDF